jgi:hypothetical protein
VSPFSEARIAQVYPSYFNSETIIIMKSTLSAACTSALLARSSASVSVCPSEQAHIAQVYPSFFYSKVKFKQSNYDDYLISSMHVSFLGQKQRECLGVSAF